MAENDTSSTTSAQNSGLGLAVVDWFAVHARALPWRSTYDPYQVWVSEIMLQQTQMERGTEYFLRWMQRFPDLSALATAHEDEVLKMWEGLGYYARARNLHRAARQVCAEYAGQIPQDMRQLQLLPGIGPYTAAAIASIAYNQDVCVVDANVERIMSRVCNVDTPIKAKATQTRIREVCQDMLPLGQSRNFNQGLMDLGGLVCTPRSPLCPSCPLATWCLARAAGVQEERPVVSPPATPVYITMATGVLCHAGRFFVQKRKADDIWAHLWEFPGGVVEENEDPADTVVREYMEETGLHVTEPEYIGAFQHSYTRYRVTMHAFFVRLDADPRTVELTAAQEYRWATWDQVLTLAFPAGHRKLIAALKQSGMPGHSSGPRHASHRTQC
ncbi:MAG: A/G-specific adenine glycosylase [Desulfovibrionales bacterium]|nr:A/G-specific adenine glycosylase [Desulfovibrionales bacterium]